MSSPQTSFENPVRVHTPPAFVACYAVFEAQARKPTGPKCGRDAREKPGIPEGGGVYKEADQFYLDKAKITERKVTVHSENVANQCREWVHDCKKTLQSLEGDLKLIINKKNVKAVITQACKHPTEDNANLALKRIDDADKRIRALQSEIRGYVDALREWLDKEPGF
ncbi:hypothetical protein FCOIX_6473 [Fusarium coicis]|nr:hypothetical protein FCOIX_6473 [Fusarium coicis]